MNLSQGSYCRGEKAKVRQIGFFLRVERGGREERISSLSVFEKLTGAAFIPELDFSRFSALRFICTRCHSLQKKGELTREQLWLGSYFKEQLLFPPLPDVTLRWIDDAIGWGVFANRAIGEREFIAEYAGVVRRRRRGDRKNGYCFEYLLAPGISSPYTIDAQDQGGISRFINHSDAPNLSVSLATLNSVNHVVFFAKRKILAGEQLLYDYGPDYWSHRPPPHKW